jgi:hypothetical protein
MKLEPRTLAIAEPIKVKDVVYWKDGGSVSLRLADRNHAEHEFMIHAWTQGPMDITKAPQLKKPRRLMLGGPEEQELYGLLLRWADKHPKRAELLKTEGATLDSVPLQDFRGMHFRLDGRVRSYFLGSRSEGSLPPDHGGPSDAAQK